MDAQIKEVIKRVTANEAMMIHQLTTWSAINSGSTHLNGLLTMKEVLVQAFSPLADAIESHTLPSFQTINLSGDTIQQSTGELLFIRKRLKHNRRILLSGHMDTVFDQNHPFQNVKHLGKNTLNGPGVSDMKGGLIVMLHALHAFEMLSESEHIGWDIIINADEEIGSPASALFFQDINPNYGAAFVYEPAMDENGTLAKNRKGSGKLTIVATGKAAHAGRDFDKGRNAIAYLAEVIVAIHALNDQRPGVTLNIGQIAGGEALNVVPNTAVIKIDVRITETSDEAWVRDQINLIINQFKRADYTLNVHGHFARPVKKIDKKTTALFERARMVGKFLDLDLQWKDSGGCCDGNNFSRLGLPVLDTLGVRGGAIHSQNEFVLLDSLVERAALTALLMQNLTLKGLLS